jgi:hypothetical protein
MARWSDLRGASRDERQAFRAGFNAAMRNQARADFGFAPRSAYWGGWGNNIRNGFAFDTPFFNSGWWGNRSFIGLGTSGYGGFGPYDAGWWGYRPWASSYPWTYWWGRPSWNTFAGWYGWDAPYYYDYGPSGNVVFYNDRVLVNDQVVGTPTAYAQSAAELAAVDPNQIAATDPDDWKPLGTFLFSISKEEENPSRVIQLAVNKEGIISGTVHNRQSDKTYTVQGRVDKETQRAAFTIGDNRDVVLETGLFNLIQDEAPVLAHMGYGRTANYLFARLPEPKGEEPATRTATAPPTGVPLRQE